MRHRRGSTFFFAILMAFALFAGACAQQGDGGADQDQDQDQADQPQEGGTLTIAAEQFPAHLQCDKADNNMAWCGYFQDLALLSPYAPHPDFTLQPTALLEGEAEIDEGPPVVVTYHINPDAVWSDGTPVTADDFVFTQDVVMDPKNEQVARIGHEDVDTVEAVDDKTVEVTFKNVYSGWREMFDPVYPKHVLEGKNWNTVWRNCICNPETDEPIGNGAFLLTDWKKNQQWTFEPNEQWYGEGPYLDRIVAPFVADTNTEMQQLEGGEVDMIYPTFQIQLAELVELDGITTDVAGGTFWQHLDLQGETPGLDKLYVRQAIAHAIDREALVDKWVRPLFPEAEILNNAIFLPNQPEYEPHWDIYDYDPQKAMDLLEENGCTKGGDGIYECDGDKLSFEYKSTSGNEVRELMFQVIQQNLKEAGIEVKNAFGEADVVFGDLDKRNFEIFQFGWVGTIDPSSSEAINKCDGAQNYVSVCDPEADELMRQAVQTLDPAEAAELWNQADAILAERVVGEIPLRQEPQPLAFHDYVKGAEVNATQGGPLWNAELIWIDQDAQS